jgi:hypothetical protein
MMRAFVCLRGEGGKRYSSLRKGRLAYIFRGLRTLLANFSTSVSIDLSANWIDTWENRNEKKVFGLTRSWNYIRK